MLCADHGPCVSGAHNTIVTARAGKDLVSSLVSGIQWALDYYYYFYPLFFGEPLSFELLNKGFWDRVTFILFNESWSSDTGLLTIGPRFGGAVDDAARYFKDAYDKVGFY